MTDQKVIFFCQKVLIHKLIIMNINHKSYISKLILYIAARNVWHSSKTRSTNILIKMQRLTILTLFLLIVMCLGKPMVEFEFEITEHSEDKQAMMKVDGKDLKNLLCSTNNLLVVFS